MANVFISHRGADVSVAERLSAEIRAAGHNVWLDEWELTLGDSIVGRINAGLLGATCVVVCYSSGGIEAPWMSREWMSTLARQLNGASVRLIPVRLSGGKPPAILEDIKYADLIADWRAGISQLLRAIG